MKNLSNYSLQKKLLAIIILITFIFVCLVGRLGYIQIIQSEMLVNRGVNQWTRDLPLQADRGYVTDCNGKVLVDNSTVYTVYTRPNAMDDKEKIAKVLSEVLKMDYDKIFTKVTKKGVSEVTIVKKVDKSVKLAIEQKNLKGVYFGVESKRFYPYGNFLTPVLGFTNVDNVGQSGVEKYYNSYLKGIDGKILTETDLVGKELDSNVTRFLPAINGMNVNLTIDYTIQSLAEKAVRDALIQYNAKGASFLVMNSNTGEIKAMAQAPSYDLNNIPRDNVNELFEMSKNSMVSSVYEPGSTFKILTSAIGLEKNAFPDSHRFYCAGFRMVDGKRIKCWQSKGHGSQTFEEGIQNSCNCVFMDIATTLGVDAMYESLLKFGIADKTGVDMNGEIKGLMLPQSMVKNVDIARIGFGQAVAVTPVGLARSVSSVINGGYLVTPHIMKTVSDTIYGNVATYQFNKSNRIISERTSGLMRNYLYNVVEKGSGKKAYVPGYKIGGKTGTAQKYENGVIANGKYISSFVGFSNVGGEEYVCLMSVDEPQGYLYYGSIVAAPYVGNVFQGIFAYKNEKPRYTQTEMEMLGKTYTMPNLIGMSVEDANKLLKQLKIPFEYDGEGGKISYQIPAYGAEVNYNTVAYYNLG